VSFENLTAGAGGRAFAEDDALGGVAFCRLGVVLCGAEVFADACLAVAILVRVV